MTSEFAGVMFFVLLDRSWERDYYDNMSYDKSSYFV